MIKKTHAILSAVLIALFGLSGCTPTVEETVVINVKVPTLSMNSFCDGSITTSYQFIRKAVDSFEEDYAVKNPDAKIQINVAEFEIAKETQFITETFDTDKSPDVLYEGYFNMSTYIYTGRVVPLDDIIGEELLEDIPPQYLELSRVNGKTYMMPYLSMQNTMAFNGKIFEDAGLTEYIGADKKNVVQTWSLEEWDNILDTLSSYCKSHNAEIGADGSVDGKMIYPMMMYAKNEQGDTHIMTLLRSRGCSFFDGDGSVKVNTSEGIAALKWLQDGTTKGYFPENSENSEISNNVDLFNAGQLGLIISNSGSEVTSVLNGIDLYSVNFPYSEEGKGLSTDFVTGFEVFDNGNEKKLALAKEFVKYIYSSDYIDYMAGGMPCSYSVSRKYENELQSISKYIDNDCISWNFTNNSPNWRGVRNVFWGNIRELLSLKANTPAELAAKKTPEVIAQAIDKVCNEAIAEGLKNGRLHD